VSRFHVLCVQTHFRRSRGRHVPLSCFARRDLFLAVPRASGPVFDSTEFVRSGFHVLCSGLIFGGTESGGSLFHILRFRTHFSTVTGATCPVFIFCASGHVFGGTEGVRSRFYVLHAQTHFWRCRVRRVPFSCFVRPNFFGGPEGDRSRVHVLRDGTHFWRYGGRQVPFSCFARLNLFSTVSRVLAPRVVSRGTEGVGSRFHVLLSLTRFQQFRGRRDPFSCFARPDSFRRYRGHLVPFSCFALPDIFSVVLSASCPILMFCASGLIFGGTEGVQSHFHVLRSQTCFRWCRVRRVSFSCFARRD
jgi:hypothetical protein